MQKSIRPEPRENAGAHDFSGASWHGCSKVAAPARAPLAQARAYADSALARLKAVLGERLLDVRERSIVDALVPGALLANQNHDVPRPFLKWAGSKRQLMHALLPRVPHDYGRYFEPFIGAGALFFAACPERAVLADTNERLIRTYRGVLQDVERVIALLQSYPYEKHFFYELREREIDACSDVEVAAWFIYLNKTGYNGLYRVNRANRFNVPFGRHTKPAICDAQNLRACAAALAHAELVLGDFEAAVANAAPGDFVYFDPPYIPLSSTSSFTGYTSSGFGEADQVRLRDVALGLKQRGVAVLVSNSSAPLVRKLYEAAFTLEEVPAMRLVNSRASKRGAISELIIY